MTEQRVWLKSRKKSYLRVLAGMLSLGVLLTANPNIVAALSVFAAEESEGESRQYVSGFAVLPEDIREQSVSLGGWGGRVVPAGYAGGGRYQKGQ